MKVYCAVTGNVLFAIAVCFHGDCPSHFILALNEDAPVPKSKGQNLIIPITEVSAKTRYLVASQDDRITLENRVV